MPIFSELRTSLKNLLATHLDLSKAASINPGTVTEISQSLEHGELSVAVVGEINRGKSTFLNALMGAKVFPTRATICTAGVTILDNGAKPEADIIYKGKKPVHIDLPLEDPATKLAEIVSRNNVNVKDLQLVRVRYPNKFTGNGIVLVDTPGVNDPEYWREEITYSYLASADAVIMLLDPMQPLSKSEVEFLDNKILGRSIANLIFVVNKIDDVSIGDRESAMNRIRKLLSQHVPNPTIYAVASKPALQAKLTEDAALLRTTGFAEFESGLIDFLARGRGGLLLRTKLEKAMGHLATIEDSIDRRTVALDTEKGTVEENLKKSNRSLDELDKKRKQMLSEIKDRESSLKSKLEQSISSRASLLQSTVIPAIISEPDEDILRRQVLFFQRDTVNHIQESLFFELNTLLGEFGAASTRLEGDIRAILKQFDRHSDTGTVLIQIERRPVTVNARSDVKKAAGALAGGVTGGIAGMAVASSITTTTITAAGAIATTAAIGTAGIIGIGILTGGIGLLAGLGLASLLSGDKEERPANQPEYVTEEDFINNERAARALQLFVEKMKHSTPVAVQAILNIAIANVIKPVEVEISAQRNLIKQMETDLRKTVEGQSETRKTLSALAKEAAGLRKSYNEMYQVITII